MIPGEFYIISKTTDYYLKKGATFLIGKKKPDKKRRYTMIIKRGEDRALVIKRAIGRPTPEIKRRAYSNEIVGLIRGCINSLIFHNDNDEFDL